ncbi:MAG: hypothetical protein U0326_42165 [Polyangiales bacterium]
MTPSVSTRVPLVVWLAACACVSGVVPALTRAPTTSATRPATDAPDADDAYDEPSAPPRDASVATLVDAASDAPAAPERVSTARGDLDGDGVVEEVRLFSDGTLRVFDGDREVLDDYGQPAGRVPAFEALSRWAYGGDEPLRVVDVDRRDRQRELMLVEMRGDEDPDGTFSLFVYRDGRLWPMLRRVDSDLRSFSAPHGVRPLVAGDGAVRVRFERCVRDADPSHGVRGVSERVSMTYTLVDGAMPHAELAEHIDATRHPSNCIMAACPVVRVGRDERRAGEVLRDLRGAASEVWQPLTLDPASIEADGALTVTLREEKREVTMLDGVYLEADGRHIDPEACEGAALPWCAADGVRATLSPGVALRLRFRVGAASTLRLWARGFYDPLP